MTTYFAGLDLGQASDPSALAIAERLQKPTGEVNARFQSKLSPPAYHFRYLERFTLGTAYPDQVQHVKSLVEQPPLKGKVKLVLDYTGCSRPVFDMFQAAKISCPVYGVSIHGGDAVSHEGGLYRVPKRDLAAIVQVLLQSNRLKIAEALPEATTLVKELLNFKVKIDPVTAHDSYAAWREGVHDDLVLALALACWFAEHGPSPPVIVPYRA